jgi:hypothetical protein
MAKKDPADIVKCRFSKCLKIHDTNELRREDAVSTGKNGSYFYHPDCYHLSQTISKIRDVYFEQVNPLMTNTQIKTLVNVINKIVFDKKVDADYLLFALETYIKYKKKDLNVPGLYYIIQDKDIKKAWEKKQEREIRERLKEELQNEKDYEMLDLSTSDKYNPQKQRSFADILS